VRRAVLLVLVVACGPKRPGDDPTPRPGVDAGVIVAPPADAAPPDAPRALADDLPTLAARSADLLDALGDALAVAADCPTLAAGARAVIADYTEVRIAQAAVADRGAGRALDAALAAYADRITAAAARMRPAIVACHADADFAAAITPVDVP
jgi:hypothetical protein